MTKLDRLRKPEDIVYRHCYTPVDIERMLASAETRSRIRRLPATQLFFGIAGLDDKSVARLLPHLTETQWRGILDLDLWSRDQASVQRLVGLQRHLLEADDPVARKLIRAVETELWQLLFKRRFGIYPRSDSEGEFQDLPQDSSWIETPDGNYRLTFAAGPEEEKVLQALLERLFALEPEQTTLMLELAHARTSLELEEACYHNRKRRMEDLGFQDYFDAIEVYTLIDPKEPLPEKRWEPLRDFSSTPARIPSRIRGSLLLFEALSHVEAPDDLQALLEELFFVCNKVLSADSVPPGSPEQLKACIRKVVGGINLGLDWWSEGNLMKAVDGLRSHYLQSYFQLGYTLLTGLKKRASEILASAPPEPGSDEEELLQGLVEGYPRRVVRTSKGSRRELFETSSEVNNCRRRLERISSSE